jgi:hypothetical protein
MGNDFTCFYNVKLKFWFLHYYHDFTPEISLSLFKQSTSVTGCCLDNKQQTTHCLSLHQQPLSRCLCELCCEKKTMSETSLLFIHSAVQAWHASVPVRFSNTWILSPYPSEHTHTHTHTHTIPWALLQLNFHFENKERGVRGKTIILVFPWVNVLSFQLFAREVKYP